MKLVEAGRDIIEGTSLITVVGKTDMHIENFKSIAVLITSFIICS
jgi:hypothetical protein